SSTCSPESATIAGNRTTLQTLKASREQGLLFGILHQRFRLSSPIREQVFHQRLNRRQLIFKRSEFHVHLCRQAA
ncbi:MAG: hypothetical protein ACM32K_02260, partial [Syntrophaceae bacterium]